MDYTLTDRLPELKVEKLDPTVAKIESDMLVDGLTDRLAVAKVETIAYTLAN